jgi:hypothetical protein
MSHPVLHTVAHTTASESNSERLRPLARNEDRGSCGTMHSYAAGSHTGKENVALVVVGPPGGVQVQRRPPSQRRDANFRMHLHTRAVSTPQLPNGWLLKKPWCKTWRHYLAWKSHE